MTTAAKIILDSVGPNGARVTTFELQYPRFIHAELMTHRMLSRNSASSRAIPTEKLMEQIAFSPALPVYWGKNASGMQARAELEEPFLSNVKKDWLQLRDIVIKCVKVIKTQGLHKQIANRPLEAWMTIVVLVTSTEWSNMRALRVSPEAQPEFDDVMRKAFALYDANLPQILSTGQWHLPLVTGVDEPELRAEGFTDDSIRKISVGRCARVSYLTHDGVREPGLDIELAGKMLGNGHMSPFEHAAMAMTADEWDAYATELAVGWVNDRIPVGNFWGWGQLRKLLPNEHDFSLIKKS